MVTVGAWGSLAPPRAPLTVGSPRHSSAPEACPYSGDARHSDTEVFKQSRRLVRRVYEETGSFPVREIYGLAAQMRESSNSIGANLMEGSGRNTRGEFRQFVGYSTGSTYELEWHTIIAGDLNYLAPDNQRALIEEIISMKKLLYRFRESLK